MNRQIKPSTLELSRFQFGQRYRTQRYGTDKQRDGKRLSGLTLMFSVLLMALIPACGSNKMSETRENNNPSQQGGDAVVEQNEIDQLWAQFTASILANDEEGAKALCNDEFWASEKDSGQRFFEQAVRKQFELDPKNKRVDGQRACLTADVLREGKRVDTVHFYLERSFNHWQFVAWDEDDKHVEQFLSGE